MMTCLLRYTIVPSKLADFEAYAEAWTHLVADFGGQHHGYYMPSEGANNVAYALFTFPSLAAYEDYRLTAAQDARCTELYRRAEESGCIESYERTFLRPQQLRPGHARPNPQASHQWSIPKAP